MGGELRLLAKGFHTEVAGEIMAGTSAIWRGAMLVAGVQLLMCPKAARDSKALAAQLALKRAFARVHAYVCLEVARLAESLGALVTGVRPLAVMHTLMHLQVALASKRLGAQGTAEWPLARVNAEMHSKCAGAYAHLVTHRALPVRFAVFEVRYGTRLRKMLVVLQQFSLDRPLDNDGNRLELVATIQHLRRQLQLAIHLQLVWRRGTPRCRWGAISIGTVHAVARDSPATCAGAAAMTGVFAVPGRGEIPV